MKEHSSTQNNILTMMSAAFAGGLLLFTYHLWNSEIDIGPTTLPAIKAPALPSALPLSLSFSPPKLKEFPQISSRPLFIASRRKPEIRRITPPKIHPNTLPKRIKPNHTQIDKLKLLGVVKHRYNWWALVKTPNAKQGVWITKELSLEGWDILEIDSNRVMLKNGSNVKELHLYKLTNAIKGRQAIQ